MNRILRNSAVILALCMLVGCASNAPPKPQSVTASDAEFDTYRTFGWDAGNKGGTGAAPTTILDTNIENAIREQLLAKGYVENNDNPDFLVSYTTKPYIFEKKSNPFSIGIGVGSFGNNVGSSVGATVPVGGGTKENMMQQLVIRALAPQSDKELWVGTSTSDTNQGFDAEAVKKAVDATMQGFPEKGS